MTRFQDLKPGLYRARWVNARHCYNADATVGFTMHRFNLVGVGEVEIPDPYIVTEDPPLETDCMAQLSLNVLPMVERKTHGGRPFFLWRAEVKVVAP